MRKIKHAAKFIILLLIPCLIISIFAGCLKQKEDEGSKTVGDNTSVTESKESVISSEEQSPLQVNVYAPGGEALAKREKTRIEKEIEERLNVVFNYDGAPWDSYFEKINLVMASGDLPDIFYNFPGETTKKWVEEELLAPMDDYLNEAPNLQKLFAHPSYQYLTYNGKHYFYPQISELCNVGFVYRKDWADNLGLNSPKTTDELYEMLKAFTKDDPDKNAKADTIGWGGSIDGLICLFGIPEQGYMPDQTEGIVYSHTTDAYKMALEYIRRLYQEGYIYKEFYVEKRDTFYEKIITGVYGVLYDNTGIHMINRWQVPGRKQNPEYTLGYFNPLPVSPSGLKPVTSGLPGYYGGLWTTSAIKDMKRIVKLFDALSTEEYNKIRHWGIENQSYTIKDGMVVLNLEERIKDGFFGQDGLQYSDWACAGLFGALPFWWEGDKFIVSKLHQYNFPENEYNIIAKESDEFAIETGDTAMESGVFIDIPSEIYEIGNKIREIVAEYKINFVIGKKSIEKDWEEYINKLNEAGLEKHKEAYYKALKDIGKIK